MSYLLKRSPATGQLLHGSAGLLVNDCPAPCECPDGLASSYALDAALFSACGGCAGGGCSEGRTWDGLFVVFPDAGPCTWFGRNSDGFGWGPGECLQIAGKNLSFVQLLHSAAHCRWQIAIHCYGGSDTLIWLGYKTTGMTPAGVYTRQGGCTAANNIELF
jgi:hypothetical protein